jgi:twitching motility protein PilT
MKKQEVDHILTRMLDSHSNVSDLNITVGKPLQVESSGELVPVEIKPEIKELTPFQTETFALNLINRDRRLTET